jgi:hypothetical protein
VPPSSSPNDLLAFSRELLRRTLETIESLAAEATRSQFADLAGVLPEHRQSRSQPVGPLGRVTRSHDAMRRGT